MGNRRSRVRMLQPLLRAHNISRAELAHTLGVSHQTVANWCTGRVQPPVAQLKLLAGYFEELGADHAYVTALVVSFLEAQGLDRSLLVNDERLRVPRAGADGNAGPILVISWDQARGRYYGSLAGTCVSMLEHLGYRCLLADCCGQHGTKRYYARIAIEMGCSGVLLVGIPGEPPDSDGELSSYVDEFAKANIPVGVVSGEQRGRDVMPGTILVAWDLSDVLGRMVDTLAQLGHTKIGAVMPYSGMYMRYELFEAALRRHGLEPGESSCAWPSEGDDVLGDIAPVIRENSGIVTTPSGLEPLVSECYASGLAWPDDISIITTTGSSDDLPQQGAQRFTCVKTPLAPIGHAATQMLSRLIKHGSTPDSERVLVLGEREMSVVNLEGGSVAAPRLV